MLSLTFESFSWGPSFSTGGAVEIPVNLMTSEFFFIANWVTPISLTLIGMLSLGPTSARHMEAMSHMASSFSLVSGLFSYHSKTFVSLCLVNLLGGASWSFPSTAHLSLTLAFAILLWLPPVANILESQPQKIIGGVIPLGSPLMLIPILWLIEVIGLLIRTLTLSVRLMGNMTSGHILISMSFMPCSEAMNNSSVFLLAAPAAALISMLEVSVALVQAFVMSLLSSIYSS